MEYIKDGYTLPVPLNLIPTPVSVYFSFKDWYKKYKEKNNGSASNPVSINADEPTSMNEFKAQIQIPAQGPAVKLERTISKVIILKRNQFI